MHLILAGSYTFYGWWDWRFLFLIFVSSLIDYTIGKALSNQANPFKRKSLLFTSLFFNLGLLAVFKYYNFFITSFYGLIGANSEAYSTFEIILPVGISFYTFQTLSYTIDLYHKKCEPAEDALSFLAFVSFFPQLVAGPIERANCFLPQFDRVKSFNYKKVVEGLRLVLWGLFTKIVIADNFGVFVDTIFSDEFSSTGLTTVLGMLFFGFQIYADFSGYSNIAIGLGRMLGFELNQNFRRPYFAKSLKEFWSR